MATNMRRECCKADKEAIILSLLTAQTNVMATIKRSALGRGVAKDHYQECTAHKCQKVSLLYRKHESALPEQVFQHANVRQNALTPANPGPIT